MPPKKNSQADEIYSLGIKLEKQNNLEGADKKYEEAKKSIIAIFARARLRLQNKLSSESNGPSKAMQMEALDILAQLIKNTNKNTNGLVELLSLAKKHQSHSEINTIQRLMKEVAFDQSLKGQAYWLKSLILKMKEDKMSEDSVQALIEACIVGYAPALQELRYLCKQFGTNSPLIQKAFYQRALIISRSNTAEDDRGAKAKTIILILEGAKLAGKDHASLTTLTTVSILSRTFIDDAIKQMSPEDITLALKVQYETLLNCELTQDWVIRLLDFYGQEKNPNDILIAKSKQLIDQVQEPDKSYLQCKLAQYYFNSNEHQNAYALLSEAIKHISENHAEYSAFIQIHEELLVEFNNQEALEQLQQKLQNKNDAQTLFAKANAELMVGKDQNDFTKMLAGIEHLKLAAQQGHAQAFETLKKLCDEEDPIPEAIVAYVDVLKYILSKSKSEQRKFFVFIKSKGKKSFDKHIRELLQTQEHKARDLYELALKTAERPDIYRVVGLLRYNGHVFEKNHALARSLFEKAVKSRDQDANYYLARLYFYGEGGTYETDKAKSLCEKINPPLNKETLYLKAEINYQDYLAAVDEEKKTQQPGSPEKKEALALCIKHLTEAISQGCRLSLLHLFILHHYDQEIAATKALFDLYQRHTTQPIEILSSEKLPEFSTDANQVCCYLYQKLLQHENNFDLVVPETYSDYLASLALAKKNEETKLTELLNAWKVNPAQRESLLPQLIVFAKKYPEAKFHFGVYELEKNNNTLILRQIMDGSYRGKAVEKLVEHYKRQGEAGTLSLLTTFCYEISRHGFDSSECQFLREILITLVPKFISFNEKQFRAHLTQQEASHNTYYDENWSDDSDAEEETQYQKQPKAMSNPKIRAQELAKKIKDSVQKQIEVLEKTENIDEEKYKKIVETTNSLFLDAIRISNASTAHGAKVEEDLQTLNHYAAKGELDNALKLVSTHFCVAQTRGLHFNTKVWNQPSRRAFRKTVVDKDHPFVGKPIYSPAVFDRADIKDFTDNSEIAELRKLKIARYVHNQMRQFISEPTYPPKTAPLPDTLYQYQFSKRRHQIQQLYSNNYDSFHAFLEWALKESDSHIISSKNPNMSMADVQSPHSSRYAYGNKIYSGHEDERLRPKYKNGRALRPHSGVVYCTLQPLDDYLGDRHNHVVSQNINAELFVQENIVHERETTFFAFVEAQRLHLIHNAKFPSFNHAKYLPSFLHKYGLDEALYEAFKKLLSTSKAHSYKQRLAILLLGNYLSAYHTLYLLRYAEERAKEKDMVLVYRDKYGNFSLKPTFDVSPTPNGDEDSYRLRRHFTFEQRKIYLKANAPENPVSTPAETFASPAAFFPAARHPQGTPLPVEGTVKENPRSIPINFEIDEDSAGELIVKKRDSAGYRESAAKRQRKEPENLPTVTNSSAANIGFFASSESFSDSSQNPIGKKRSFNDGYESGDEQVRHRDKKSSLSSSS